MTIGLPLDKMTTEEKLRALEEIWDSLAATPSEVPSPAWHEDILKAREEGARKGESKFLDWDEAKRNLRKATE